MEAVQPCQAGETEDRGSGPRLFAKTDPQTFVIALGAGMCLLLWCQTAYKAHLVERPYLLERQRQHQVIAVECHDGWCFPAFVVLAVVHDQFDLAAYFLCDAYDMPCQPELACTGTLLVHIIEGWYAFAIGLPIAEYQPVFDTGSRFHEFLHAHERTVKSSHNRLRWSASDEGRTARSHHTIASHLNIHHCHEAEPSMISGLPRQRSAGNRRDDQRRPPACPGP